MDHIRIDSPEAEVSIVIVAGQHLNELQGMIAAADLFTLIMGSHLGHQIHSPTGMGTHYVQDASGRYIMFPAMNWRRANWLLIPRVNPNPWPVRRYGATPGRLQEGIDLNRTWPAGEIVSPYWGLIEAMPGQKIVIDVHGTSTNRDDHPAADDHLYASGRSKEWLDKFIHDWMIVDEPGKPGSLGMTLEDAANAQGWVGITLEIGKQNALGGIPACRLLGQIVDVGLDLI